MPARHPATQHLMQFFTCDHLSEDLQAISEPFCDLAQEMVDSVTGPECAAGLRKLLEAKDCFVRARVSEKYE